MYCTVVGLGEVGSVYASALVEQGHDVTATDPGPVETPPGVRRANSLDDAVGTADTVLVLTAARAASAVAAAVRPALRAGCVYADFTSSSPMEKKAIGRQLPATVLGVDVAILGPVIALGAATPLMAAGPGAERLAVLMRPIGAPIDVVAGDMGEAMAHKMLRSVLMKGLAAVVMEAVQAGAAAGHEPWIRAQIARELAGDGAATIDRFLTGSVKHASRRADEMASAAEFLDSMSTPADMTRGAEASLVRLASQAATV